MDVVLSILEGMWQVMGEMSPYLIFGFLIAGVLSVFLSPEWVERHLGGRGMMPILKSVLFGIPLYANVSGIIPIAESLIAKGVPIGTTLAFMMSVVGASFPEFIMLKQVMRPRLLIIFFLLLLVLFTLTGWLFNIIL